MPYKESAAGHRKLGSMIWVAESLGNYRWAVQLGLELCVEYNKGRGRAAGRTALHSTQKVLEWLRDHEPNFRITRRTPVRLKHLAMPDKFKKAMSSVEAYRDYYYSKRRTMEMTWPAGRTPKWWEARKNPKKWKEMENAKRRAKARASARKRSMNVTEPGQTNLMPKKRKSEKQPDSLSMSVSPSRRLRRKMSHQ